MIPKDAICKTCGWFDGDSLNPSRMGICSDPAIVRASPVGKSTEVVKGNRKACVNWKPREVS